ncbi:MAG: hypothetical protein ACOYLQ_10115 [Hyphomicrobiaceae bacterium]
MTKSAEITAGARGRRAKLAVAGGLACLWGATFAMAPAVAAGICVECSEPAATYRCVIVQKDTSGASHALAKAANFICMTELAKAGGHGFCRVTQGSVGGLCNGPERVVTIGDQGIKRPDPSLQAEPADGKKAPPATLADLAKETVQSSGAGVQKAGDAIKKGAEQIGGTVGNAWDCMISLFKRC